MVRLFILATAPRSAERRLGRLDAAAIERLEVEQAEWPHIRLVDVLVGERDVLQHRHEAFFAFEARGQVPDSMQAGDRMERAAMMTWRQVGRSHHSEPRSG